MPKPACVPCQRFFRPKRIGRRVMENMPVGPPGETLPGLQTPDLWVPYKIWVGDIWECEGCGTQIVAGWAHAPLAEHFDQPRFADLSVGITIKINDC